LDRRQFLVLSAALSVIAPARAQGVQTEPQSKCRSAFQRALARGRQSLNLRTAKTLDIKPTAAFLTRASTG
jgi:hypothetical protein